METLDRFAMNLATLGPIGRLPKAPGTWGSAFAAA
ncbi:MAG: Phosphatidylglycerophosphatase, partial [Desulfovibrionales bacterium]|nr:Phosphatidylglycerophosphatase [Desulfovibrionales bacterium]